MSKSRSCRILALDVRPRRFGYVAFESSTSLMDFGVKRFDSPETGSLWVNALFSKFRPSVLVLRRITERSRRNQPRTREVLRWLRRVAKRASIQITLVSEGGLKDYFGPQGHGTKYQIARALAVTLSELHWKLPPRRHLWQTEHWNAPIFDAASLGVVYFAEQRASTEEPAD